MVPVLDNGYVALLWYNDEDVISRITSICYAKEREQEDVVAVFHRMESLYVRGDMSPFEFVSMRFYLKAPIFVLRQIFRHRTAKIMEMSRRYVSDEKVPFEFYTPEGANLADYYAAATNEYHRLLAAGFRKEQARVVLPVSLYSECFWQIDARNFINFLQQRAGPHAQMETREYALAMVTELEIRMPALYRLLREHVLPKSQPPHS